ncbi:hypothetical protein [Thermogymnomonas acidicola]|uniref:hypothetical protein n=1 Tax=Thermogymnomonas acidicola TaxID=399579 RepID=UPI0009463DFB|nr:hypothetical protein [Thermogymnomonas acidicola]
MLKSDINFVTGNTRYIDDIFLPGMLYMSVVRSQYARARLLSVKGGITAKDIGFLRMASVGEGASEDANSLMHPRSGLGLRELCGGAAHCGSVLRRSIQVP